YRKLSDQINEFQSLLEEAYENNRNDEFYYFLSSVKGKNSSELIERLKKYGYTLRKKGNLSKAFKNMGYRLLEQARAGKRDDVFYSIMRIFVSAKEDFPLVLIEAFKPYYSQEMFKIFIFSFLSGVLGQEEQTSNKE
ncbi:MAG: hypothetical protein ACPL25_10540, partial [Ignavibacteria bacterium]